MQQDSIGDIIRDTYESIPVLPSVVDYSGKALEWTRRNSALVKSELLAGVRLCAQPPRLAFAVKTVAYSTLARFCEVYAGPTAQSSLNTVVDTAVSLAGTGLRIVTGPVGFITQFSPVSLPGWGLVKSAAGGVGYLAGNYVQPLLPAVVGQTIELGGYAVHNLTRVGTSAIGLFGLWHAARAAQWTVRQNPLKVHVYNAKEFAKEQSLFESVQHNLRTVRYYAVSFGVAFLGVALLNQYANIASAEPFGYQAMALDAAVLELFTAGALKVAEYGLQWARQRVRTTPDLGFDFEAAISAARGAMQRDGVVGARTFQQYRLQSQQKAPLPVKSTRLQLLEGQCKDLAQLQTERTKLDGTIAEAQKKEKEAQARIGEMEGIPLDENTHESVKKMVESTLATANAEKAAAVVARTSAVRELDSVNREIAAAEQAEQEYQRLQADYQQKLEDYQEQQKNLDLTPEQRQTQQVVARNFVLYALHTNSTDLLESALAPKGKNGSSVSLKKAFGELTGSHTNGTANSQEIGQAQLEVVQMSDTKFVACQDAFHKQLSGKAFARWMKNAHPEVNLANMPESLQKPYRQLFQYEQSGTNTGLVGKIENWAKQIVENHGSQIHLTLNG